MDCRNRIILALGLLSAAGCVPQNSVQSNSPQAPPVAEKAKDPPKRPPSAETCVALGNYFADGASQKPQGSVEQEKGFELARTQFQQALAVDPNYVRAYQALGQLAISRSDYNDAVKWYRKGLERMPREGSLWYSLGWCQSRHKDWAAAIESLRHAIECNPDNKHYYSTLGFCLVFAGQMDQPEDAFAKSYGETLAHYHLARVLAELQRYDEARKHVQIVVEQEPKFEPAQHLLAQLEGREPRPPM